MNIGAHPLVVAVALGLLGPVALAEDGEGIDVCDGLPDADEPVDGSKRRPCMGSESEALIVEPGEIFGGCHGSACPGSPD